MDKRTRAKFSHVHRFAHNFPRFSCATCTVITSSFDWFMVLSVIGWGENFGFGRTTLN